MSRCPAREGCCCLPPRVTPPSQFCGGEVLWGGGFLLLVFGGGGEENLLTLAGQLLSSLRRYTSPRLSIEVPGGVCGCKLPPARMGLGSPAVGQEGCPSTSCQPLCFLSPTAASKPGHPGERRGDFEGKPRLPALESSQVSLATGWRHGPS